MARENRYDGIRAEARGSFNTLPLEFEIRTDGRALFFGLLMAGLVGVLAYNVNQLVPPGVFGEYSDLAQRALPIVIGAAALLLALRAVVQKLTRQSIRITNNEVSVKRRTPFGAREWREPLSAYQGVRWKRFIITSNRSSGQSTPARYRNVIELAHSDPGRELPLVVFVSGRANAQATLALAKAAFSNRNPTDDQKAEMERAAEDLASQSRGDHLRGTWEMLAATLGLPAIDARDGGESIRQVEDLDKSVRQLAKEGKTAADWAYTPPPAPLELESGGDGDMTVFIRTSEVPILVWLFGALGGIVLVLGVITFQFGLAFGGLIFAGFGFFIHFLGKTSPRRLKISGGQLSHFVPHRKRGSFKVDLAAIEGIELRDRDAQQAHGRTLKLQGKQLHIASDQGDFTVGAGLKPEALQWLRGYLLDAARKA